MTNLADYLNRRRGEASALAKRAGLSKGNLSSIRNGKSRPSPELAKKIEQATDGEVTAASLLGLEAGAPTRLQRLHDGRCLVWVGDHGDVSVPAEVLQDLGVGPGEALAYRRTERGWELTAAKKDLRGVQELAAKFAHAEPSAVDELLAERRAEASRE